MSSLVRDTSNHHADLYVPLKSNATPGVVPSGEGEYGVQVIEIAKEGQLTEDTVEQSTKDPVVQQVTEAEEDLLNNPNTYKRRRM